MIGIDSIWFILGDNIFYGAFFSDILKEAVKLKNGAKIFGYYVKKPSDFSGVEFAAESHVDRFIKNPEIFLETKILGTQTLMDVAKAHWTIGKYNMWYPTYKKGKKFLQLSTDEVYGTLTTDYKEVQELPVINDYIEKVLKNRSIMPKTFGEKCFTEESYLNPNSPYAVSKTSADMLVRAYAETYKFPINVTRCSNNYGPYHFPEKLIPLIIKNILEGKELPVYRDGKQVRD